MSDFSTARPFLALYAAALWWVAFLTAQTLLTGLGAGLELALANSGSSAGVLFGVIVGEEVLSLCALWAVVAAVFLHPRALEPGAGWRHPLVMGLTVLLLLGTSATTMSITTLRWAYVASLIGAEDMAWMAVRQQYLGVSVRALHVLTWCGVVIGAWMKLNGDLERDG